MFDRTSLQHRKVICALIPVELPELGNLGLVRGPHPEHGAGRGVVPPEPGAPRLLRSSREWNERVLQDFSWPILRDPRLAVVLRRPRPDELPDGAVAGELRLQRGRPAPRPGGALLPGRPVRELRPVVRLEDPRRAAEELDRLPEGDRRLPHGALVGEAEVAPPARLVQDGVLAGPPLEAGRPALLRDGLHARPPLVPGAGRGLAGPAVLPLGVVL